MFDFDIFTPISCLLGSYLNFQRDTTYVRMDRKFTELEKTILMAVLVTVKNVKRYVREEEIVLKFPRRQRKMVKLYFSKLVKGGYLTKHPVGDKYTLTEKGIKVVKKLLVEGATLWKI